MAVGASPLHLTFIQVTSISKMIRFHRPGRANGNGAGQCTGRVRHRFCPEACALESRCLLSINVSGNYSVLMFSKVGFSLNPVAQIAGVYIGQPDINPAHYQVQIDWGDTTPRETGAIAPVPAIMRPVRLFPSV